jgi:NTE family protein
LILGGGGVIGIAWETGVISGLLEGGIDVREADLVIGTSAGSMVGTRVAAGHDLSSDADAPAPIAIPVHPDGMDMEALGRIFGVWSSATRMTEALCREIGAAAAAARTADEKAWIQATGGSLGVDDWPETPLRITGVDIETGHFEVHTRQSGAPLHEAVASSCAVPGMFPPIRIGGRRYMDGGVRSGTSADAALGVRPGVRSGTSADAALDVRPEIALVIAPLVAATAPIGAVAERALNDEVAELRAAGTHVAVVTPQAVEVEAFGPNMMDPARAEDARAAGRARGLALAEGEAQVWHDRPR